MFVLGHAGLTLFGMISYESLRGRPRSWDRPGKALLLVLFSLLPDLVDKPLAIWVIPQAPSTRLFAHSLAFWILTWSVLRALSPGWAVLHLPVFFHLILDRMWLYPRTLLFPLLGWERGPFALSDLSLWAFFMENIRLYSSNWRLWTPELLGLGVLLHLGFGHLFRPHPSRRRCRLPREI